MPAIGTKHHYPAAQSERPGADHLDRPPGAMAEGLITDACGNLWDGGPAGPTEAEAAFAALSRQVANAKARSALETGEITGANRAHVRQAADPDLRSQLQGAMAESRVMLVVPACLTDEEVRALFAAWEVVAEWSERPILSLRHRVTELIAGGLGVEGACGHATAEKAAEKAERRRLRERPERILRTAAGRERRARQAGSRPGPAARAVRSSRPRSRRQNHGRPAKANAPPGAEGDQPDGEDDHDQVEPAPAPAARPGCGGAR